MLWGALRPLMIAGVALFVLYVAGLVWFAIAPSTEDRTEPTDAIVVLTA